MAAETARLFFALMPPARVAAEIAARRDRLSLVGRPIAPARLHLTLLFLGDVGAARQAEWVRHAASLRVPAFGLRLDRLDYFARPAIAWLGASQTPSALCMLHEKLNKHTVSTVDSMPFRPHVSLARRASPLKPGAIAPIEWPVRDFSLIVSGEGGTPGAYRALARWPLVSPSVDDLPL